MKAIRKMDRILPLSNGVSHRMGGCATLPLSIPVIKTFRSSRSYRSRIPALLALVLTCGALNMVMTSTCCGWPGERLRWMTGYVDDKQSRRHKTTEWKQASDYPFSKEFKNVYKPKWDSANSTSSTRVRLLPTATATATATAVVDCDELVQMEFQALDAATSKRLGTLHAAQVDRAWVAFAKEERRRDYRYCVAQCGPNKCCPSGMVGPEAFEQIAGQQPTHTDTATNGAADVTLVTQGSIDRLQTFRRVSAAWNGPIVALFVIYNQTRADWVEAAAARADLLALAAELHDRLNVQLLLYTVTLAPKMDYYGSQFVNGTRLSRLTLYPVNTLRNVVADRAGTNWIFALDVDFVPSATLYDRLRREHLPQMAKVNRAAMVVPHFEVPICPGREMAPPRDFDEMDAMLLEGVVFPFHVRADRVIPELKGPAVIQARQNHLQHFADGGEFLEDLNASGCERPTKRSWPWGILPTDYSQWFRRSIDGNRGIFRLPIPDARVVSWSSAGTRIDHSAAWEPFVIVRRVESEAEEQPPRFSEAFVGRYRNKVEYISHLRTKRFKFYTVLQEFATHVPHSISDAMLTNMQFLKSEMIVLHIRQTKRFLATYQDLEAPAYSQFEGGYLCNTSTPSTP